METLLLNPLSAEFWIKIGTALLCGAIIGFERQLRGKPAGIRTSILICLGTQIFVHLGAAYPSATADPTRVIGQVVTGIGFLGAGVIMSQGGVIVKGVTSAAGIWMLAAIGSVIGLGQIKAAIALTVVTVGVLVGVELLETSILWLRRGAHARDEHCRRRTDTDTKTCCPPTTPDNPC
ncbi:MAG: hypothetical protein A2521_00960 [Deltaproteobacteria bacterium RIFOXYD12_FULL_57_12]|nr:MAG: hypothetical protein A2521_00960 [Deltaproteobacteria bacterium RIFOXYD12_FULL_57_12]